MLLSSLPFGSLLTYSPRGEEDAMKLSRQVMVYLKQEKVVQDGQRAIPMSEYVVESLKRELDSFPFKSFFGPEVSLVPVPKSSLMQTGSLWVPGRLVQAMSKAGLGTPLVCLERKEAVNKAAWSKPSDRPKPVDHYNTLAVKSSLERPKEILLVDDVITRGATMLGAASRLHEVFPETPIRAFAVIRTMSDSKHFSKINDSCLGEISLRRGDASRDP